MHEDFSNSMTLMGKTIVGDIPTGKVSILYNPIELN